MSITTKAMLVNLSISQWTARKYDKTTTAEVDANHGTNGAGRYNKLLIAQDAIKTVAQVATAARTFHYTNTLPWNDQGARILPTANYLEYTQAINGHKAKFFAAVATLVNNYPQLIADARANLKTLFKDDDYPDVSAIQDRYQFTISIDPIPEAGDFRVEINQGELAILQAEIEERTNRAQEAAMSDLWSRLYQVVSHAAETLKEPDKIFRDSLIGNISDLVELLPRLNVTGDSRLNELTQEIGKKLAAQRPDDLRKLPIIRQTAAQDAAAILDVMAQYMGQ